MAALPLPANLEEVTPAWLTAALRTRHPAAAVKASEVVEVIHGTCTKVRLALSLAGGGDIPSTLVLKAGFEPHSDSMYPTLEKEVRAWRELLPHLPLHTPRCHFAACEPERRLAAVLMDDLVARGVRFCHPLRPASPAQVARRLAALARFHAASLGSPRLAPGGDWAWVPDILEAAVAYFAPFLEAATFARYAALPRAAAAPATFLDRLWLKEALASLVALSREQPRAVLHGDTHLGNLYEEADGTPGFFDVGALKGPPLVEVAYHLGCALDPAARRTAGRALLAHYLASLQAAGGPSLPLAEAERLCAAYLVFGFLVFLVNDPAFQAEAVNAACTARFAAAMVEENTPAILAAAAQLGRSGASDPW